MQVSYNVSLFVELLYVVLGVLCCWYGGSECKLPEFGDWVALAIKDELVASLYLYFLSGEPCFESLAAELTGGNKGAVVEIWKDMCASCFKWQVG